MCIRDSTYCFINFHYQNFIFQLKRGKMKRDILDHVAICTDSIEKSVIWYTENFKCDILYQDEHGQCLNSKM